MADQGTPVSASALGTLAITLMAHTKTFQDEMIKAIGVVKQFNMEVQKNKDVLLAVAQTTQASAKMVTQALKTKSQTVRNEMRKTGKVADQENKKMMSRGKQQLGAVLSFQEGIAKFIKLNLRWFVIWRSMWFLWGQLTEAMSNFKAAMHEVSLALRTGADDLRNEVELMIKRNDLTRAAIRFTAQHTKSLQEYIKSFYYLTTAGLSWKVASQTIQTTMKTAIALDEDAIATTRTLTSLYNVFGETLTGARTPTEKMQKIAAILTATFRDQDIEMADYNKALTYVGAFAKIAGVDLETLVASLGVLGTHFVKSSKGGTALARSFAQLLKYPDRLAAAVGIAFDPNKPLQFEAIMRAVGKALREGTLDTNKLGVSVKLAGDMIELFGLRGIRVITLAENLEKLADQIQRNREATFDLVEAMIKLVESDPTAQLKIFGNAIKMNIVALGQGFVQTQQFSYSLASLNAILRKTIDLSEELGRSIGGLVGAFTKIAALVITWKLPKILAGITKISAGLTTMASRMTKLKVLVSGMLLGLGKFFLIWTAIAAVFDTVFVAYDIMTGNFTRKSKKFAADQVFIEKGWLSKTLSFLDARTWAYRVANFHLMREWDAAANYHETRLRQQGKTEKQIAKEMAEFRLEYWSKETGLEKEQLEKRYDRRTAEEKRWAEEAKAAEEARLAEEEKAAEKRLKIQKDYYKKLRKLTQSELEYELESLHEENQERVKAGVTDGKTDEYFAKERLAIIAASMNKSKDAYDKAYDTLRKIQRTALDKQILDVKKALDEIEKQYTLNWLDRIRFSFDAASAEAKILSDVRKKVEDDDIRGFTALNSLRKEVTKKGLTELSSLLRASFEDEKTEKQNAKTAIINAERIALKKMLDLSRKHIDFSNEQRIVGEKKDLDALEINYKKRKDAIEKAGNDFAKSKEISDLARLNAEMLILSALLALDEQYEKEKLEINEKGDRSILAGIERASADYLKSIGDLSDSVQRIFETMYQGIEEVLTSSFMRLLGMQEEYGLESMNLVNERREEEQRNLKQQLEEGRISREMYYAQLDELDRKYSEEIEKRQTGLVKTLSDLQKSLTKAVLAEIAKMIAGKIALKIKEWAIDAKDIAIKSFKAYAGIPWVGIGIALASIATIWAAIRKFSGKKLAKGGIFEGAQPAVIGEEGPEAVVPLARKDGRLVLSEQGLRVLSPLFSLENQIPALLSAVNNNSSPVRLNPASIAALTARTSAFQSPRTVELNVTFQGDRLDFAGSMPMMDDISAVDRVYDEVWLPAKMRNMERLGQAVSDVVNA